MTSTTRRNATPGLALALLLAACGPTATSADAGNGAIYDAWRAGRSHIEVTATGTIARLLGTQPGRTAAHEGFLLHLRGAAGRGLTVRVEDNVDFTGQIPLTPGADVVARGEYIYDSRGGIVHYTHRDPRGRHAAGYITTGGKLYQ